MVNEAIRQTLELEVIKQAGESPIRFQKLSDRALWRASPVQRKEETTNSLCASAVAVGAPTTSEGVFTNRMKKMANTRCKTTNTQRTTRSW
jgi:hypothetical protein